MKQYTMTREDRIRALRQELLNLKAELRKARGNYMRSTIRNEIQAVCRELVRLEEP